MAKNLRFAVIGAGRIGLVHAGSVYDTKGADLVYVVDPITEAADKIAASFDCKAAADPMAVITSGEIDAVIIGSPTPTHIPLLSAAIDAGIHALCEKPIDLDMKNVDALREKAKSAKTHVAIGFNRPLDPHFDSVRQKVAAGEIGNVEQVIITSRDPGPAPQEYIAVSGGIFRDMTIHDFDMARHFVKDITEVYAVGTNVFCDYIKAENDYDSVNVVLKGAKGEIVTIIGSRHSAYGYDQRIEVFGSKGMLQIDNLSTSTVKQFTKDATTSGLPYLDFFLERYATSYRNELKAFIRGIEDGKQYNSSYDDGRAALILADAALESSRIGKAVKVNLN
jgi:myo-inositol 2-dehydrogenase / D-chiro-inositol 1-dehydrogenase